MTPGTVALLVAAGSGRRLGHELPKALVPCAGRPLLSWALDALLAAPSITEVIVALPEGVDLPEPRERVRSVVGGDERSHSVRAALSAVVGDEALVAVHDAARPLITPDQIESVIAVASRDGVDGAIAAAPVTDTIKQASRPELVVEHTIDRSQLWSVQTPQVFRRAALSGALEQSDEVLGAATDDAALVEAQGGRIAIAELPATNIKVTTPVDLQLAEMMLRNRFAIPSDEPLRASSSAGGD